MHHVSIYLSISLSTYIHTYTQICTSSRHATNRATKMSTTVVDINIHIYYTYIHLYTYMYTYIHKYIYINTYTQICTSSRQATKRATNISTTVVVLAGSGARYIYQYLYVQPYIYTYRSRLSIRHLLAPCDKARHENEDDCSSISREWGEPLGEEESRGRAIYIYIYLSIYLYLSLSIWHTSSRQATNRATKISTTVVVLAESGATFIQRYLYIYLSSCIYLSIYLSICLRHLFTPSDKARHENEHNSGGVGRERGEPLGEEESGRRSASGLEWVDQISNLKGHTQNVVRRETGHRRFTIQRGHEHTHRELIRTNTQHGRRRWTIRRRAGRGKRDNRTVKSQIECCEQDWGILKVPCAPK